MNVSDIYSAYMYAYPHKTAYRSLDGVHFSDYKDIFKTLGGSLYFHIPFCGSKCGYCNLFSVTGQTEAYMEAYVSSCEAQFRQYDMPTEAFHSLTIGGGDPLFLPPRLLRRLLSLADGVSDIRVETSPNETTAEKLALLKEFGAARISIGVQSFSDCELKRLKRLHDDASAQKALYLLKAGDFSCINVDLIYGIPDQTIKSFVKSLDTALSFEPDEIFIYPLYIRAGTALLGEVVNENAYEMYKAAREHLMDCGYFQTSMRQFLKKPPQAPKSCGFENMLSVGCGGRSYIGNLHFCHPYALENADCLAIIDNFIHAANKADICHGFILNEDERKRRFILKNLLYFKGVSLAEYTKLFKTDIVSDFPVLTRLLDNGEAETAPDFLRLTPLGLSLSDRIGTLFISEAVALKMSSWVAPQAGGGNL